MTTMYEMKDVTLPSAKSVEEFNEQLLCLKKLKKLIGEIYADNRDLFS